MKPKREASNLANRKYRQSEKGIAASERAKASRRETTAEKRAAYMVGPIDCEWRVVAEAPDYEISEYGDVRRLTAAATRRVGHVLKPTIDSKGYASVGLVVGADHTRTFAVHVLVAKAFIGPRPSAEHLVAHGDGKPASNHHSNLRWATALENSADARRHGRMAIGERVGGAKLTESLVRQLRADYRQARGRNGAVKQLLLDYGISRSNLFAIAKGKTWAHVQ